VGTVQFTYCPVGQWTYVSNLPIAIPRVTIESRSAISVFWRRYTDTPPFYVSESAELSAGRNDWWVPPSIFNAWWFNPQSADGLIREV
jgi:hypothetical protein